MTHNHMEMDMDMGSSTTSSMTMASTGGSMSGMTMAFTNSQSSTLFSSDWVPQSTGAYAGTCIFLIALALIYRSLISFKAVVEKRWHDRDVQRRYITVAGQTPDAERFQDRQDSKEGLLLSTNGVAENVRVVKNSSRPIRPWRLSVDLPRACLVVVIVGVGYLLMLAVMTMNVGYFLSILGGTFLGELIVGRYIQGEEH